MRAKAAGRGSEADPRGTNLSLKYATLWLQTPADPWPPEKSLNTRSAPYQAVFCDLSLGDELDQDPWPAKQRQMSGTDKIQDVKSKKQIESMQECDTGG